MYLLFSVTCTLLLTTSDAILNGKNASIRDFPYQVGIIDAWDDLECGGTIITESWVLTAATCVSRGDLTSYKVRAGTDQRNRGGSVHQVDRRILHSAFYYNFSSHLYENDLAVVRVDPPFVFDETRQPIEFIESGDELTPGRMVNVSGFGWCDRIHYPKQLQWTEIPIMGSELCNRAYKSRGGVPKGYMCADYFGLSNKSVCYGDQGGPMVVDGRLGGYPTWIYTCEYVQNYLPVLYTNVSHYRNWIEQHLKF